MPRIFHIATRNDWIEAQKKGSYTADSLTSEGFIHCSQPHQVIDVANRLFRSRTDLVVLHIEASRLRVDIRYENLEGGDEQFPHIYGELHIDAVIGESPIEPSSNGTFSHYRPFFT